MELGLSSLDGYIVARAVGESAMVDDKVGEAMLANPECQPVVA